MVWVKNHYQAVEYDKVKDTADAIPLNQYALDNFKKITVSDTATFFKNGDYNRPLVWYGKSSNKKEYEYFNQPGLHPETGKTLKPISRYIIKKYILSK
jgi:C1A family cysteine protease